MCTNITDNYITSGLLIISIHNHLHALAASKYDGNWQVSKKCW